MNEALKKAQQRKQEMREQGIKIEQVDPIEKARRNPKSLRLAVTAFCFHCMGGPDQEGARRLVRECTAPKCPLYSVRPWQKDQQNSVEKNSLSDDLAEEGVSQGVGL